MDLDHIDTVDELPARPRRTIPEADRELLELAARALGAVQVEDVDGEEWLILHFADGSIRHGWNPLIHRDDTFVLAFNLEMKIKFYAQGAAVIYAKDGQLPELEEYGESGIAAACRAVTRAAAEIGKAI
jgi:hypothetical protein